MQQAPSERTRIKRVPKNASYDSKVIAQIVDEALLCQVGFQSHGSVHVIPMVHWRMGNELMLHGANSSRLIRQLSSGLEACISLTLIDGLVLARSAFHHSMNYRSVVVYASARVVSGAQKIEALDGLMEKLFPGRVNEARQGNEKELRATSVLAFSLNEAAAKIRKGMPNDEPEDMALPVWSGVLPLRLTAFPVQPDPLMEKTIEVPQYLEEPEIMKGPAAWER